jgi:hypothetical protein
MLSACALNPPAVLAQGNFQRRSTARKRMIYETASRMFLIYPIGLALGLTNGWAFGSAAEGSEYFERIARLKIAVVYQEIALNGFWTSFPIRGQPI